MADTLIGLYTNIEGNLDFPFEMERRYKVECYELAGKWN